MKSFLKSNKIEILSGLTVALALVPEAVAFSFVAQVNPLVGLYAAFFVGLITSVFGGRPGMISGATGALAVVMTALVVQHGVDYLFAAVVLMGIIQILAGVFKLGKFFKLIPHPVMLGFVNGLAIVIFLAQLGQFKYQGQWLQNMDLFIMIALVLTTMAIIYILPKFTKIIPAPLAGILGVFAITEIFGIKTLNVGDMASIAGDFPDFIIPNIPFNFETLMIILPYSIVFASIGLIESLLALTLIDEITETKGRNSKECFAQGLANIVTGFFGGMGGCAMIGQSMINISSGARKRLSGIVASVFLLISIMFLSSLIEQIPLAALTGVMFMVVIGTFAWSSFRIINKIPRTDAVVIILVSLTTVFFDLAVAVVAGVILSALSYAWQSSKHITAVTKLSRNKKQKTYELYGPIFFGSTSSFKDLFNPKNDPDSVIINFEHSRVWDHSGIDAIEKLANKYKKLGKTVKFKRLSSDCATLLEKIGAIIEVDKENDPKYDVVMDRSHIAGS